MIKSKQDYKYYLEADRIALGKKRKKPMLFFDEVWVFQRLLRKVEYYKNCKNSRFYRPYYYYLYLKFHLLSLFLGFHIKPNVFGPGLSISHPGTIVVNGHARIGANCRIHVCTVIGTKAGYEDVTPKIGNNVYIGPGAKIFGDIEIADGIVIGANSVVTKSFTEPNIRIAGAPAKKINDKGSEKLVARATEILNKS
ncbi:serine O-acetyltransferase [Methanosarcina sp.]|uniref:serine O-acetyltransferase n=1 Tax=Methanosarcina sp. TaxID=2213 RepID=UPI003C7854C9